MILGFDNGYSAMTLGSEKPSIELALLRYVPDKQAYERLPYYVCVYKALDLEEDGAVRSRRDVKA